MHREPEGYLDPGNYCAVTEFHDERNYARGLIRLLSTLQSIRDNKNRKSYVKHYISKHECLPLWVASKCMTFGTLATFYEYQQRAAKTRACISLAKALGESSIRMKHLTYAFRTLPGFRNVCAHSERFYCAGVGKNGEKHFPELLRALSYVTLPGDLDDLVNSPLKFLAEVGSKEPELKAKILEGMHTTEEELQRFVINQ